MIERLLDWLYGSWRIAQSERPARTSYRLRRFKKWLRSDERSELLAYRAELQAQIRARRERRTHDKITRDFLKRNGKTNVRQR